MVDELENLALQSEALVALTVPGSAAEALADWKAATQREYDSLMTNEVWSLVSRTKEQQPVTGKWHFAVKVNEDGKVTKFKARFVARGFTQTRGSDYHETYSQTVRLSTLMIALASNGHQVPGNGHKDSLPKCTQRRRDFSGAARMVQAGRRRYCL